MEASAKDGVGAGRGPCGLRNSELGPRPHNVIIALKNGFGLCAQKISYFNFLSSCIIMAMPMMAAPVSAMGCAKNTPFKSK